MDLAYPADLLIHLPEKLIHNRASELIYAGPTLTKLPQSYHKQLKDLNPVFVRKVVATVDNSIPVGYKYKKLKLKLAKSQLIEDQMNFGLYQLRKLQNSDPAQFIMEVYVSGLIHQNILSYRELVFEGDDTYMVTQYTPKDFIKVIKYSKLTYVQITDYMKQITSGLQFLHKHNLIHKDLKLDNLYLVNNKVKLFGFGCTSFDTSDLWPQPKCDHLVGSEPYLAPEVLQHTTYSFQSDMWALGIVFFLLCTGYFPWYQAKPSDPNYRNYLFTNLKQNLIRDFEAKAFRSTNINSSQKSLLVKLLNPDPESRFTCEQVLKFLETN